MNYALEVKTADELSQLKKDYMRKIKWCNDEIIKIKAQDELINIENKAIRLKSKQSAVATELTERIK